MEAGHEQLRQNARMAPSHSWGWINFILVIIILWLLMMVAISELELRSMPDQWRLNLANNSLACA